jgi:hypothetical protein
MKVYIFRQRWIGHQTRGDFLYAFFSRLFSG